MMPRLVCGLASPGWRCVRCLKRASASASCPARSAATAFSYSGLAAAFSAEFSSAAGAASGAVDGVISVGAAVCVSGGSAAVGATLVSFAAGGTGMGALHAVSHTASRAARPPRLIQLFNDRFTFFHLGVTRRQQCAQGRITLLHPFVVDLIGRAPRGRLVERDGLLLEWIGLFFQQHVVLLELELAEPLRALRGEQVLAELRIDLGAVIRGRGGHVGDAVARGAVVCLQGVFHRLLLELEAFLERMAEFDRRELRVTLLREQQARLRRERAAAVVARRTALLLGSDQPCEPLALRGDVALLRIDIGDALMRLLRVGQGLWISLHENQKKTQNLARQLCARIELRGLPRRV